MTSRRLRIVRGLVLVALLLVPVVASGHHHAAHQTAPCATCALTYHTPAVVAGTIAAPAATELVVGMAPAAASRPAEPSRRLPTGRGPPAVVSRVA
jgi:hypothetical protein